MRGDRQPQVAWSLESEGETVSERGGGWIRWAIAGVIVPIVVALIGAGVLRSCTSPGPPSPPFGPHAPTPAAEPGSAQITLSRATAPRGSRLTVYGTAFHPGELVEIQVQDTVVATVTADSQGQFARDITIPNSARCIPRRAVSGWLIPRNPSTNRIDASK